MKAKGDKFPECVSCLNWNSSRTTMPCAMCEQANKFESDPWPVKKPEPEHKSEPTPSAVVILSTSAGIMEERGKQYDQEGGERSMGKTVAAFNIITGRDLKESEGWLLMQILKDVRDRTTVAPHADSLVDCVAFSALKAESRLAGK